MNRYMGNSVLPLLIKHSRFYSEADNYASLLDATLHTVYRLSKNRMLTKGQRESVSDFLVALTRWVNLSLQLRPLHSPLFGTFFGSTYRNYSTGILLNVFQTICRRMGTTFFGSAHEDMPH